MSRTYVFFGAFALSGAALWACATAAVIDNGTDLPEAGPGADSGGGNEGGVVGDAGCPQFDLNSDPKHCGSCTKACASTEVCSAGACKAQCTAPTVKCVTDAGGTCVDTSKDPNHCGGCTTACMTVDPASLPADNGNPDSGVPAPDGGYDAGLLPATGTPTCDGGACGVNCPPLTALCSDNICYDTKDNHDHCGDCNTACAANTEWCTAGKCCPVGHRLHRRLVQRPRVDQLQPLQRRALDRPALDLQRRQLPQPRLPAPRVLRLGEHLGQREGQHLLGPHADDHAVVPVAVTS